MCNYFKMRFKDLAGDDAGMTTVEYGIAIVIAIGVGFFALALLAGEINLNNGGATSFIV